MPWVRFTEDFDFTPRSNRKVTFGHKAGVTENVVRECADAAVSAGKAVRIRRPGSRAEARALIGGEG